MYIYRGKLSYSNKFRDEAVTIIFPSAMTPGERIYLFSQLSTTPATARDRSFFAAGVIETSDTPKTTTFSLSRSGKSYHFSAVHLDNDQLLLRHHHIIAEDLTTLSLIYHVPGIPIVHVGALDLEVSIEGKLHKAEKETLVAVCAVDELGTETLLCVLWQWTEAHTASKVNAHFTAHSYATASHVLVDRDFTFSLERGEPEQKPRSLLVENADTQAKVTVPFSCETTRVFITNDTPNFVNCMAKSDSLAQDIFTWGGLGLAALGIPFVFVANVPGLGFALGSFAFAHLSTKWNLGPSESGKYSGMPPQGTFTYDGYGDVSIFVLRIKVDGESILVQSVTQEKVPAGSFSISKVDEKSWVPMIRLDGVVPPGKALSTRGFLQLKGMRATFRGFDIDEKNSSNDMGIYAYDIVDPSKLKYHGSISDRFDSLYVLESNKDYSTYVLFKSQSHDNCQIERLLGKPDLVLVMRYVDLMYPGDEATAMTSVSGPVSTMAQMLHSIGLDNQPHVVYNIAGKGKRVMAMRVAFPKAWSIKLLPRIPQFENTYTFLRIREPVVLNATVVDSA